MNPREAAATLRRIATAIDNSKQPTLEYVRRDIATVLSRIAEEQQGQQGQQAIDRKHQYDSTGSPTQQFTAMLEGMYEEADKLHEKGFSKDDLRYFESGLENLKNKLDEVKRSAGKSPEMGK